MRRKRKEKAYRTNMGNAFLLLFILVPLVGIILGYVVSNTIIIPYMTERRGDTRQDPPAQTAPVNTPQGQPPQDESPEDESQAVNAYQQVFDVEGFELYRIQVGAFSNQENALKLAQELNGKGMAAAVDMEGMYKVYTLYSFSRDMAMAQMEQVRKHYKDAHVSHIRYPSVDISFLDSSSQQAHMLRDQLKECRDMLTSMTEQDMDGKDISDTIQEQKDRIQQFQQQISQTNWTPSMEKYGEQVTAIYNAMLESYTGYDHQTNITGQVSMELVNCYVELLKQLSLII